MSSLNKVMLIGHLGKDPEVRYTTDGTAVATFSLATSENWTDKNGTKQEHTEWHNIVAWRRFADLSQKYLTKGRQVYVEGRLQTRDWNDREGVRRRTTEIIVTQIVLLGSRAQSTDAPVSYQEPASKITGAEPEQAFGDAGITDDDIPF
jgi:single-strand DNA-binding protein